MGGHGKRFHPRRLGRAVAWMAVLAVLFMVPPAGAGDMSTTPLPASEITVVPTLTPALILGGIALLALMIPMRKKGDKGTR